MSILRIYKHFYLVVVALVSVVLSPLALATTSANYVAIPPFLAAESGQPNVVIAMDISGSMKAVAYRDTGAGNWRSGLHDDFNPTKRYFGYFDSEKKYQYEVATGVFYASGALTGTDNIQGPLSADEWNGNFLNWLAMRRIDVIRKVMVGGRVESRIPADLYSVNGQKRYVLLGQHEPYDYSFRKAYSGSSAFTPAVFPNGTEFLVNEGTLDVSGAATVTAIPLGDDMEIGQVTMDWSNGDPWKAVTYENTYTDPVVVALAVSYNGGDPTVSRVDNVTSTGFDIRLQEYDYKDGNHTTEDIVYLVAEKGRHSLTMSDSSTVNFFAGVETTNNTLNNGDGFESVSLAGFSSSPVVFTGISSFGDSRAVHSRTQNVASGSFDVILQNEEDYTNRHPSNEDIHYIAIDQLSAGSKLASDITINIGTVSNVTHSWTDIDLSGNSFATVPFLGAAMQTAAGTDPANVRIADSAPTTTIVDVQIDEEESEDTEVNHAAETVGYIAVTGAKGFQIRVAVDDEPKGVIQDNANTMRFGLAVYNYDHVGKTPTNLYNGNNAHGSTFQPCYPDTSKDTSLRTTTDICLRTDVRAPNAEDNIVQVIEQHPLIWGTTPIAETLYDIWGYFGQGNIDSSAAARPGATPQYDTNGSTSNGTYPAYVTHQDWDPYYYPEYNVKLECAKSFVLHFNDGEPYKDWDGTGHPAISDDGVGSTGLNQMLDDVAWNMRKYDCRTDSGMTEHQEIISYYVYAALGEGELNDDSTRKMRESAANGGFFDIGVGVDKTGANNHLPDPAHPANFKTYYQTFLDGGTCTVNEWDRDGDCNPDTFYMADDGEALVEDLNAAFASILSRSSSGGAASVVASSASGEGAIYNALFQTSITDGTDEVKWVGNVFGVFVDNKGLLRADGDGNKTLGTYTDDPIIDMCFDDANKQVLVKLSQGVGLRPNTTQVANCSSSVFDKDLEDLDYIFDSTGWLSSITNANIPSQRTYSSTAAQRYIITALDKNDDGWIAPTEKIDFLPGSFTNYEGILGAADNAEATKLINWVRGQDQTGDNSFRTRNIGSKMYRLGDVIYSTPTLVSRPAEALDLLHNDSSYLTFLKRWKNRRHMLYAGANDGMLHAFNAGWFNPSAHKFYEGPPGTGAAANGDDSSYELGAEMWAYIPQAMLPHLKYISGTNYGVAPGNHIYGVDLTPRIFDAQVFNSDGDSGTHPGGWGTILVGGMRLGGGALDVDHDNDPATADRTLTSSYFIFDITNPEEPPVLMAEFTDADLGFTLARPHPLRVGDDWYLMFTSGPTNTPSGMSEAKSTGRAQIYLMNLDYTDGALSLENDFASNNGGSNGKLALADVSTPSIDNSNSFISEPVVVDYNLDEKADAVYFGSITGDASGWGGDMYRIQIQNNQLGDQYKAVSDWSVSLLSPIGKPISSKPGVGLDYKDNRWIYVGTGRFYTRSDAIDTTVQTYYGLKEPRDVSSTGGPLTWGTSTNLVDVSNAKVYANTGVISGVSLTGLDSGDHQKTFEAMMAQYTSDTNSGPDPQPYVHGWKKNLGAGNKVLGGPALLGGTLAYTAYEPEPAACNYDGTARLYALNYITGTANSTPIIGTYNDGSADVVLESVVIGKSPSFTPSIHRGDGYTDAKGDGTMIFTPDTDGNLHQTEADNEGSIYSGEMSWRKIFGD